MKSESHLFIFYVKDDGTLIAEGIEGPKTRFEGYGIASDVFDHIHSIQDIANQYRSVVDILIGLYWDWRDEQIAEFAANQSAIEDASAALDAFMLKWDADLLDDADNVSAWLKVLDENQFSLMSNAMKEWASEAPESDEEGLTEPVNGQDAAFEWFSDGMFSDEAEQIGIDIIEGDTWGSDYVAAELPISIEEANKRAAEAGINIRFIADGDSDDNI
jgi:hypothetical protein